MSDRSSRELAFTFSSREADLVGILHMPEQSARRGVLIVVGGPQYRIGSHRQFVLLARDLAAQGLPVMRFDHRGIGDSDEPYVGFEALNHDIAAAIDAFMARCPGLRQVVLWGLCDAASAILFYAHTDPRVAGVVLLNPWVRTPESEARAYLRHYYLHRLAQPEFWRHLASGQFQLRRSASALMHMVARGLGTDQPAEPATAGTSARDAKPLPARMADGLAKFKGPVLLVISGQDLTAREFEDSARASQFWRRLLDAPRISRRDLADADHTFSRRVWSDKVGQWTRDWMRNW
jgi:uncharacterized protein